MCDFVGSVRCKDNVLLNFTPERDIQLWYLTVSPSGCGQGMSSVGRGWLDNCHLLVAYAKETI